MLFVGPCYKINRSTGEVHEPFSLESRSGKFLRSALSVDEVEMAFDNVIDGPVLDDAGRERNPSARELVGHLRHSPLMQDGEWDVVVGLSGPVRQAFEMSTGLRVRPLEAVRYSSSWFLFADHPSYVMRRPASERQRWAVDLLDEIKRAVSLSERPLRSRAPSAAPRGYHDSARMA